MHENERSAIVRGAFIEGKLGPVDLGVEVDRFRGPSREVSSISPNNSIVYLVFSIVGSGGDPYPNRRKR